MERNRSFSEDACSRRGTTPRPVAVVTAIFGDGVDSYGRSERIVVPTLATPVDDKNLLAKVASAQTVQHQIDDVVGCRYDVSYLHGDVDAREASQYEDLREEVADGVGQA